MPAAPISTSGGNKPTSAREFSRKGVPLIPKALQSLIELYQRWIRPLLGMRCRFYPSCSHYAQECLDLYPLSRACAKISWRLVRCQPWHPGGFDLP